MCNDHRVSLCNYTYMYIHLHVAVYSSGVVEVSVIRLIPLIICFVFYNVNKIISTFLINRVLFCPHPACSSMF